jgi:single-stranded DNA-binding protein
MLMGYVGQYGVKLSYTDNGKPQTTFTVMCTEAGKDAEFKSFIPCLIVGPHAEGVAEALEPGDLVVLEGKLSYKPGRSTETGQLMVVGFDVRKLDGVAHLTFKRDPL